MSTHTAYGLGSNMLITGVRVSQVTPPFTPPDTCTRWETPCEVATAHCGVCRGDAPAVPVIKPPPVVVTRPVAAACTCVGTGIAFYAGGFGCGGCGRWKPGPSWRAACYAAEQRIRQTVRP